MAAPRSDSTSAAATDRSSIATRTEPEEQSSGSRLSTDYNRVASGRWPKLPSTRLGKQLQPLGSFFDLSRREVREADDSMLGERCRIGAGDQLQALAVCDGHGENSDRSALRPTREVIPGMLRIDLVAIVNGEQRLVFRRRAKDLRGDATRLDERRMNLSEQQRRRGHRPTSAAARTSRASHIQPSLRARSSTSIRSLSSWMFRECQFPVRESGSISRENS